MALPLRYPGGRPRNGEGFLTVRAGDRGMERALVLGRIRRSGARTLWNGLAVTVVVAMCFPI